MPDDPQYHRQLGALQGECFIVAVEVENAAAVARDRGDPLLGGVLDALGGRLKAAGSRPAALLAELDALTASMRSADIDTRAAGATMGSWSGRMLDRVQMHLRHANGAAPEQYLAKLRGLEAYLIGRLGC